MQSILASPLRPLSCRITKRFCRFFCDFGFKHTFTKEEVSKILSVINSSTPEALSRYSIAKFRLQKIVGWKQLHGQFSSLNEILELDDFGVKVLEKFCQSIVEGTGESSDSTQDLALRKTSQFLTPKLTEEKRDKVRSLCSVQVGIDSVSWCRMELQETEAPSVVTHWQYFSLNSKKSHLSDLTQMILHVNQLIPESDAFVLETPITRQASPAVNATQIAVNVRQSQVIAMMTLILSLRSQDFNPCVFFLKTYLAARLFGTLVGKERTSSIDVVSKILASGVSNGAAEKKLEIVPKGKIISDPDVLVKYQAADGVQRECMGRCLMLGVCFLRLSLLKCPTSLATVNRKSK